MAAQALQFNKLFQTRTALWLSAVVFAVMAVFTLGGAADTGVWTWPRCLTVAGLTDPQTGGGLSALGHCAWCWLALGAASAALLAPRR
ncbi:MAG: hypothetical protein ACFB2Z_03950 [Maricaulaceae bacterium]